MRSVFAAMIALACTAAVPGMCRAQCPSPSVPYTGVLPPSIVADNINVCIDLATLVEDTTVIVYGGGIYIGSGGISGSSTAAGAHGMHGQATCQTTTLPQAGGPGGRGHNLTLITLPARISGTAQPQNVEVGGGISLHGAAGGIGGNGVPAQHLLDTFGACCHAVNAQGGASGGQGGVGGNCTIRAHGNITLYNSIESRGGDGGLGGNGGDKSYTFPTRAHASCGRGGPGGPGGHGGAIVLSAAGTIAYAGHQHFQVQGGSGSSGGSGGSNGNPPAIGGSGGAGGHGGNVVMKAKYIQPLTTPTFPFIVTGTGGAGGSGGPGGSGGSNTCTGCDCSQSAPCGLSGGVSGGRAGRAGDGGYANFYASASISIPSLTIDMSGNNSVSNSGDSGVGGIAKTGVNCTCEVALAPPAGVDVFHTGAHGGQIIIKAPSLTLSGCTLSANGGQGSRGGRGGHASVPSPDCGRPPGGAGGDGGQGGIGGLIGLSATTIAVTGTASACGGDGGPGGSAGCNGGAVGAGGPPGFFGNITFLGTGPTPGIATCTPVSGSSGSACP